MKGTKRYLVNSSLIVEESEDAVVFIDMERSVLHDLNNTGREITQLITNNKSEEEITNVLAIKYKSPFLKIKGDVHKFILALKKKGILIVKGSDEV